MFFCPLAYPNPFSHFDGKMVTPHMRPRRIYSCSSSMSLTPLTASISAPYLWSRNDPGGRRGDSLSFSRLSVKIWLALKLSVVLALLFTTTHFLYPRGQALVFASAKSKNPTSIGCGNLPRHHQHHQQARAGARCGFYFRARIEASKPTSDNAGANMAASQASLPYPARLSAIGGELVQKSKPASLAIIVPFTLRDAEKVEKGLQKWSRPGDPCAAVRTLSPSSSSPPGRDGSARTSTSPNTSPVDVLFWFNRDLDDQLHAKDANIVREIFLDALKPAAHCFGRVEFKSARLTEDEDAYPFGPSNQWYDLFLSPERPLAPYDYAFWCEHDVMPVQPGWIDALLREVTFSSVDFFVRGSLHRGRKLDDIVLYPDDASWVGHINGNALYRANDPEFTAMISQTREANRGSMSFTSSFDTAMWIQHVTSFASRWEKYQNYAHKFQYTDLIQNLNEDVSWPGGARDLVARSPGTFLVHGSQASAGEVHRKKTFEKGVAAETAAAAGKMPTTHMSLPDEVPEEGSLDEQQQRPFRPKAFLPGKVAVVIPLIASQIEKLRVLFSLSSEEAFRPCDPEKFGGGVGVGGRKGLPIDLVFQISSTWLDESGTAGNEAYHALSALVDEYPRFTSCFDRVHTRAANLSPSEDIHTAYVFTGPNLQFRRMMNDSWLRSRFSHVLLLEPDATPIKHDWLERLWVEARGGGCMKTGVATEESFWIKGTAYRGFRGDWVRNRAPYDITKVSSMWAAMNGNGIYNLQDPEFYEFMDRVWEAHPDLPYDGAIHAYLFDVDNFEHTKRALTKIRYSSYVQNHGATRFDIATLRRESPETYIVHSSCRAEFPNKKPYCFVCDKDTPWSEECQVKLNSYDNFLGYDRFTTGLTYRGPEISNANEKELWRENVVL